MQKHEHGWAWCGHSRSQVSTQRHRGGPRRAQQRGGGHLAAAVLQHHVHVLPVSKVSMEGYDIAVFQVAVQGDLPVHLQARPHVSTPPGTQGHNPTPPGQGPLWGPPAKCGAPGAQKVWAYLTAGAQLPGPGPSTRHHLEGEHSTGGHVHQLVAAAEGTLRWRGTHALSGHRCADRQPGLFIYTDAHRCRRCMDTQLSPLHPHTQPHEHRGKRRDTNTDVSISGYVQQPDHNTVRGHTTRFHTQTRKAQRWRARSDTDLVTAPQSFYKKLDTCNTRVHVHTPGRTTHGHNTRRQRPASAAAPCDLYSTDPGANPASRPQTPNSRRHAAHAEVKPGRTPALSRSRLGAHTPPRPAGSPARPETLSRTRGAGVRTLPISFPRL